VDIIISPFFKKLLRLKIKNEQIENEKRVQKKVSTIRTEDRRRRVRSNEILYFCSFDTPFPYSVINMAEIINAAPKEEADHIVALLSLNNFLP
jgi:hypothetical protein